MSTDENPVSSWAPYRRRLAAARATRPFTATFAVILPVPATLAIVLGDRTSQALTNLGAGTYSRLIGILLLIGCAALLHGIATGRALGEAFGMVLCATGCFLYGVGVIIGLLPFGGVIAGFGFIGIGTGFLASMFSLTTLAHYRSNDTGPPPGPSPTTPDQVTPEKQ